MQSIKSLFLTQQRSISKVGRKTVESADFFFNFFFCRDACVCTSNFWLQRNLDPHIYSISAVCFTGPIWDFKLSEKKKSALRCNYNGGPHEAAVLIGKHPTILPAQTSIQAPFAQT